MYIMYSWPESDQLVGPKVTNWGLIIPGNKKQGSMLTLLLAVHLGVIRSRQIIDFIIIYLGWRRVNT